MTIECTLCRGSQKACYILCMYTCMRSAGYSRFVLLHMYHFTTQGPRKFTLYCFQLLVRCTQVERLVIHAICVVPQGWVFYQILSLFSYAPQAKTSPSRILLQCCKWYCVMLKIGSLFSRSTDSPWEILGYISGGQVSHIDSLLLLLWSWFLSLFLISTIMSLNRNQQQSSWIVYLVGCLPGYRQSLMWRVAWHHMWGIW
jgi:hypothetical protein